MILKVFKILAIVSLVDRHAALKIFEKSQDLKVYSRVYDHGFDYTGGRLSYFTCPEDSDTRKCLIAGEKTVRGNQLYSCKVFLPPYHKEDSSQSPVFMKGRFGDDKVVLLRNLWSRTLRPYTMITYLRMKNCTTSDIKFKVKAWPADFFVSSYVDTFDVFFKNGENFDRVTIDIESGKIIRGPITLIKNAGEMIRLTAISDSTPDKGFLYFSKIDDSDLSALVMIKPDGSQKELARYAQVYLEFSVNNNFASVCVTDSKGDYINCTQYNVDGKVIFNVKLQVNEGTNMRTFYNLREGGILLAFTNVDETCDGCKRSPRPYSFVVKVNANGKVVGKIIQKNESRLIQSFYENDKGNYCLVKNTKIYIGIGGNLFPDDIDIRHECYDDEDFTI